MSAPTDQFTEIAETTKRAFTTTVRTWTDSWESITSGARPQLPDAKGALDRYFDFARQALDNQRSFAHTVLETGTRAAETVTQQATRAAGSVGARTAEATES